MVFLEHCGEVRAVSIGISARQYDTDVSEAERFIAFGGGRDLRPDRFDDRLRFAPGPRAGHEAHAVVRWTGGGCRIGALATKDVVLQSSEDGVRGIIGHAETPVEIAVRQGIEVADVFSCGPPPKDERSGVGRVRGVAPSVLRTRRESAAKSLRSSAPRG